MRFTSTVSASCCSRRFKSFQPRKCSRLYPAMKINYVCREIMCVGLWRPTKFTFDCSWAARRLDELPRCLLSTLLNRPLMLILFNITLSGFIVNWSIANIGKSRYYLIKSILSSVDSSGDNKTLLERTFYRSWHVKQFVVAVSALQPTYRMSS